LRDDDNYFDSLEGLDTPVNFTLLDGNLFAIERIVYYGIISAGVNGMGMILKVGATSQVGQIGKYLQIPAGRITPAVTEVQFQCFGLCITLALAYGTAAGISVATGNG